MLAWVNKMYDWKKLDKELIEEYKKDNQAVSKFCSKYTIHKTTVYDRLKRLKVELRDFSEACKTSEGSKHPRWKGGKCKTARGYVLIRIGSKKYVPEHRLVMEKYLGRKLSTHEITHHKDETFEGRSNNSINNLQMMSVSKHITHHHKGKGKGYTIYWNTRDSKWVLQVRNNITGKWDASGYYKTKEQALKLVEKLKIKE